MAAQMITGAMMLKSWENMGVRSEGDPGYSMARRMGKRCGHKALLRGGGLCEGPRNHAEADVTELSHLERLLASIAEDKSQVVPFYEALIASNLYVPIPGDKPVTADEAAAGAKLDLMVVQAESGRLFMPVFDTPERAQAHVAEAESADDEARSYAELPAEALIRTLDPKIAIVLNPGATHTKIFDLDELRHLRAEMRRLEKAKRKSGAKGGGKVAFRAVLDLPDDVAASLAKACDETPSVYAVYMLEIPDPKHEYDKKYLVLLDIDDEDSDRAFKEAGQAVGQALADHFAAGTYLEMANFEEEEAYAAAITKENVPPVYSRGAALGGGGA
jgi:hypothetical protein